MLKFDGCYSDEKQQEVGYPAMSKGFLFIVNAFLFIWSSEVTIEAQAAAQRVILLFQLWMRQVVQLSTHAHGPLTREVYRPRSTIPCLVKFATFGEIMATFKTIGMILSIFLVGGVIMATSWYLLPAQVDGMTQFRDSTVQCIVFRSNLCKKHALQTLIKICSLAATSRWL